ncbi:MAG TPA: DUF6069 family protein [Thermomicrobiaceae bacterium]|nr:DUF6069 family protein [Thermomicrobiaceae bacterium]
MERIYCDTPQRVSYRNLIWAGALAAFFSASASSLIYAIASAFGAIPHDVVLANPTGSGPLTYGAVIAASIVAAASATALFAFIGKVSRHPIAGFRVAVIALLLSSLSTPFTVAAAPGAMKVSLISMHVAVASICYGLLTRLARA